MNIFCKVTTVGFITAFMMLASSPVLYAGTASLSWNAPTTNVDGGPVASLTGYKIYYGTTSGLYTQSLNIGNVTNYVVPNLTDGVTYFFRVTAVTTSGYESDFSNEASKLIPVTTPTLPGKPGKPIYNP